MPTAREASTPVPAHPAPQAHRINELMLAMSFLAAPIAWAGSLTVKYATTSSLCGRSTNESDPSLNALLYSIDAIAFVIALATILISWRHWQLTKEEASGEITELAEIGEGRTRFLALWGMLMGGMFAAAIFFGFIASVADIC